MNNVDLKTYEIIADYIFKTPEIKAGVKLVAFDGYTLYMAEKECGITANTLTRHYSSYKKHIAHLESLGFFD